MSSTLYVNVSTEPMAESVHEMTSHVDGTTVAIVAMKAATVIAEQNAAKSICENVDRGFHSLVLSQLSQKCAKARSIVDAKIQELNHFGMALRRIHDQMDMDFHRIAGRYSKVFKSLNNTLKARIYELDRAATELATVQMPRSMRRMLNGGVQTPIYQRESLFAVQVIASTIARKTTSRSIELMCGLLQKTATLQASMTRITDNESIKTSTQVLIPAVFFEADDLNLSISDRSVHIPDFLGTKSIESAILQDFQKLTSADGSAISGSIKDQAKLLLSKAELTDRVRSKALELLSGSQPLKAQAGQV